MEVAIGEARDRGWSIEGLPAEPHIAPDLEALIPDLGPGAHVSSTTATDWRSSTLNRVIKQLGLSKRDVRLAIAMSGYGEGAASWSVTHFPGVSSEHLWAYVPDLSMQPKNKCELREHAGRRVYWCNLKEFNAATWVQGDMVVSASASDLTKLEAAIAKASPSSG
jgi:hypothetical protein